MRDADDEPQEEELEDGEEDDGEESDGEESDDDDDDGDDGTAEIASLREHLATTPGDYDSHLRLIALLKAAAELDGVRAAREALAATFPLPEGVWLAWVDDEERLAEEIASIENELVQQFSPQQLDVWAAEADESDERGARPGLAEAADPNVPNANGEFTVSHTRSNPHPRQPSPSASP